MSTPGHFHFTQKLFLRRGQELLTLRDATSGRWDLPGGRLAPEEHFELEKSLAREIVEELGDRVRVAIEPRPFLIFSLIASDGVTRVVGAAFEAEYLAGDIVLSPEHDRMAWVDVATYDPTGDYSESGFLEAMKRYLAHARR